ncbi:MAG TPA: hypothetical protein VFR09_07165 [Alphaproteobacteria bacterium]|nr:hypothetical protein [Alphaproteobacteria bacterium]
MNDSPTVERHITEYFHSVGVSETQASVLIEHCKSTMGHCDWNSPCPHDHAYMVGVLSEVRAAVAEWYQVYEPTSPMFMVFDESGNPGRSRRQRVFIPLGTEPSSGVQ